MVNKRPNNWNDVTVAQFVELYSLQQDDFKTEDEYNIHLLSILTDTSIEELEELSIDEYEELLGNILFIKQLPIKQPQIVITTEAGKLYLKDQFNTLTIGEFIDLENLFTQSYIKNLPTILAILYRQKDIKNSLLFLDTYEPYGDWIFHRAPLFYDLSINQVYGVCNQYLEFRTDLFEKYSGLFDESSNDEENGEEFDENESVIARAERRKEEAKQKTIKKWGWDIFLLRLAKNDPIKLEEATGMPLIQALNILSMKKELGLQD